MPPSRLAIATLSPLIASLKTRVMELIQTLPRAILYDIITSTVTNGAFAILLRQTGVKSTTELSELMAVIFGIHTQMGRALTRKKGFPVTNISKNLRRCLFLATAKTVVMENQENSSIAVSITHSVVEVNTAKYFTTH